MTWRTTALLALAGTLTAAALVLWPGSSAPRAAPSPPAAHDTLRLVFVGDINFARSHARNYLLAGRGAEVFAGVRERLRAADFAMGNLESILLERGRRADTTNSPVFAGPQREGTALLRDAGFDAVGTANNHAWDFGRAGLLESLRWLDSAGIPHTGTGPTLDDAWRPVVVRARGWTVAVFGITGMFNYEDLTVVGHDAECCVAWLDTTVAAARFRAAREAIGAQVVIAFVHAGPVEYRALPHATVVAQFRALARSGADLVIGHHPHVPQGMERVDGVPVLYSLGNFVFKQGQPWTDRGLWADVTVAPPDTAAPCPAGRAPPCPVIGVRVLPLVVGYTPTFATGADSARVMAHFDSISARIGQSDRPIRRRPARR